MARKTAQSASAPASPPAPVWPAKAMSPIALMCAFYGVCLALTVMGRNPLWFNHLEPDLGEYSIRVHRFLDGTLTGSEYPPVAVMAFLVPALLERCGVGFVDAVLALNMAAIGLHLAILNQVQGRASALLFALLMVAAGPIVLFRFELLVSLLLLLTWWAWRDARPRLAGALLALAILTKLYPVILLPLLLRSPDEERRWQIRPVAFGLCTAAFIVLLLFSLRGDPLSIFTDVARFHEHKPVALESVTAVAVIAASTALTGHPPRSVNEYGIHGLPLPGVLRLVPLAGLLATFALLFVVLADRPARDESTRFVLTAQAALLAVVVWSTLFQPQYLLWPLIFTVLLPTTELPPRRVAILSILYASVLLSEQVIYPCQYTRFLDWFYKGTPIGGMLVALIAGKIAVVAVFCMALADAGVRQTLAGWRSARAS